MIEDKPTEWSRADIGTLCNLINGRAFKSTEWGETGLPIIRIQNLNNPLAKYNYFDGELNEKHRIENGDLLFAWSGTPGTSFGAHVWQGEVAALNQHIFKIEFGRKLIDKRFLQYAINQTLDVLISGAQGGVGLRHVTKGKFEAAEISFPPLAEQKVIADKLDTLLAQVDNTKTRLECIPGILKRFRQSVLAAAVSGRLTEEWRPYSKDKGGCSQLINEDHHINDTDLFPIPSSWRLTAMGNVSGFQQGLQIAKSTRRMCPDEGVLPILRTVNYENNFQDDVHYAVLSKQSIVAESEDIILSRTGTVGMVLTGFKGIMHNNSFRLNFKKELLVREFLIYFLKSPLCQEYIKRESGRSSQPDLTHRAFSKCPITIPPRTEQTEIVRRVDQLFAYADTVERQVNSALERVNQLTQSILAKAFRGELTAQWRAGNPELISGDNNAEALLERIKVERAAQVPTKRPRKKAAT